MQALPPAHLDQRRIAAPPPPNRSDTNGDLTSGAPLSPLRRFWQGWLRIVASPLLDRADTPTYRALQRRRALASALLFALLLFWTALVPVNLTLYPANLTTAIIILGGYLTLLSIGALIRTGRVTGAAVILNALIYLGFLAIQGSEQGAALVRADNFYLLIFPILLAATLMPVEALFLVLIANVALVAMSALLIWPAAVLAQSFLASQATSIYAWPLATMIITTVVAYVWTSSMQRATTHAEFLQADATLSRATEANARQALEHDAQELLRVVDAWSSGNLGAQVGSMANANLRRVAVALSSYAGRVRTLARGEYELQRERQLATRVAETILYYRQGAPVTWPAPSGLPSDLIIRAVATPDPKALLEELRRQGG